LPEADDLTLLIDAARAAGDIAMGHFRKDPQTWDKPDGTGPVTVADLEVDGYLKDRLLTARPDHGWLSEETEDDPARLTRSRAFIVDPIDGTRAYIDGSRDWSVSVALTEGGVPLAGVVYLPAQDVLYAASTGTGARRNGQPLAVSRTADPAQAQVLANRANLDPHHWQGATPGFSRSFRSSLAYRLCLVAEGRFDAMFALRKTWEWDIAAGALILSEAGGRVTDQNGGGLQFNQATPLSDGILGGGPDLHASLLAQLS